MEAKHEVVAAEWRCDAGDNGVDVSAEGSKLDGEDEVAEGGVVARVRGERVMNDRCRNASYCGCCVPASLCPKMRWL